jgi:hypothetical protein
MSLDSLSSLPSIYVCVFPLVMFRSVEREKIRPFIAVRVPLYTFCSNKHLKAHITPINFNHVKMLNKEKQTSACRTKESEEK